MNEAIVKAREKYLKLCRSKPELKEIEASWLTMNLEPDPLTPLRELIETGNYNIGYLKDRIKNLKSETVDSLSELSEVLITAVLRGDHITPDLRIKLEEHLNRKEILVLEDLNRAARFIISKLDEEDLKPSRRLGRGSLASERLAHIQTSDLFLSVLDFGDWGRNSRLLLPDDGFDAISASLFLSYLYAPGVAVKEFARMLKPGGRIMLSSMKPDSDISGIFTRYIAEQTELNTHSDISDEREKNLREARNMLNEAAALFSLEEDGLFKFFNEEQLNIMMKTAGFTDLKTYQSLGSPSQAIIVTARLKSV